MWLLPCLAAILAYRCVTQFEFTADARMLILENRFLHDPRGAWAQVTHDYFWSSSGNVIPYWRPFTKLAWWCEWQAFGPHAGRFLLVSVAWHAIASAGLYKLARDLGGTRWIAAIAATVFALHPVAIEPVALLMARSDTVAAACVLWSLIAWRQSLQSLRPARHAWLALHVLTAILALASKEAAVVLPVVMLAWSLVIPDQKTPLRARLVSAAPSLALTVLYLIVRRQVLAAEHPELPSVALDFRPLRWVASLSVYLANTFPLRLQSDVRDLPIPEASSPWFLLRAVLVGAALVAVAVRAWRRDRTSFALIVWVLAAIAPVVLTRDISVPVGPEKFPLADRWLYFALAPALLAWARVVDPLLGPLNVRRLLVGLCGLWGAWMLLRSTPDRAEFRNELAMLDNEDRVYYLAVPEEFRSPWDHCRFEERKVARTLMQNDPEAAYRAAVAALRPCGRTPERISDLLDACVRTGRWSEAETVADEALAHPPRDARGHARLTFDAGLAFLARGRSAEAEKWLAKSVSLGMNGCVMPWVALAEAAKARNDTAEAATRLEHAYDCGGRRDPSLLLAAATWLVEAHQYDRAGKLLAQALTHALTEDQRAQAERIRTVLTAR